jgi:hypothetical protein
MTAFILLDYTPPTAMRIIVLGKDAVFPSHHLLIRQPPRNLSFVACKLLLFATNISLLSCPPRKDIAPLFQMFPVDPEDGTASRCRGRLFRHVALEDMMAIP